MNADDVPSGLTGEFRALTADEAERVFDVIVDALTDAGYEVLGGGTFGSDTMTFGVYFVPESKHEGI